ncbi:MAG: CotH kinase family protein [Lachnospiraceae bacterium]|nr:CotH kinase family protein [Lachnospiraceae bacterium]
MKNRKFKFKLILIVCVILVLMLSLYGVYRDRLMKGIVINEVCSSNLKTLSDNEGKYNDWIELYNSSDKDMDITGYSLSRTKRGKLDYVFPETVIKSGEHKLVYWDGITISAGGDRLFFADPSHKVVSELEIPSLEADSTYGRLGDGKVMGVMEPTPGERNLDEEKALATLKRPVFSVESGFYDDSFQVEIQSPDGGDIYYTLDGSEPDEGSQKYTGAITVSDRTNENNLYSALDNYSVGYEKGIYKTPDYKVSKGTVIRAKVIGPDGAFSTVSTKVYFCGVDAPGDIPSVSLVGDPEDLFSDGSGIYVLGERYRQYVENNEAESYDKADVWWWTPGNYSYRGRLSERKVEVQFFSEDGKLDFSDTVGARIKGGGSRGFAQKSIRLTARGAYAEDIFGGELFDVKGGVKQAVLYSGGDDVNGKLKDMLAAERLKKADISVLSGYPVNAYINGEYWGMYILTENFGSSYIYEHYNVPKDNILMIKNGEVEEGKSEMKSLYDDLNRFIMNRDFSDDKVYDEFCEMVDIDSFVDYFAAQIYIAHTNDWPGSNFALWRSIKENPGNEYEDCRWRWMLFDVNSTSMEKADVEADTLSEVCEKSYILKALINNPEFKKALFERMKGLGENEFDPEEMDKYLSEMEKVMSTPMKEYYKRFYGSENDLDFNKYVNDLKYFFDNRNKYIPDVTAGQ